MSHHRTYGNVEGPLGFPMLDSHAQALDRLLKALPRSNEYRYRKAVIPKATTDLDPGERSDVSWISSESIDRQGEVVIADGMDDSQFRANPLVTLQHKYELPPVGRSLWRRRVADGDRVGIKAKTIYPARPADWPDTDPWPPDKVFALVQAGMMNGKSIGFLPTRVHVPDAREAEQRGWNNVSLVIDEWVLLEYACCFLPANQDSLVETVSKAGIDLPPWLLDALGLDGQMFAVGAGPIPFTPLEEIERAVANALKNIDVTALGQATARRVWDSACGRV